jgi:hypothetical protein
MTYQIGNVLAGPIRCSGCLLTVDRVVAMERDEEGDIIWRCAPCAETYIEDGKLDKTPPNEVELGLTKEPNTPKEERRMATKPTGKGNTAASGPGTFIFRIDKETDRRHRMTLQGVDNVLVGSLYISKDALPDGATGIKFTPTFITD